MAQRGADAWIASLPVSHAKTFRLQADALDSTEGDRDSSSPLPTLQTLAVRDSSFWRTSQASLLPPPPLWTKPKENSKSARPPESWENWPTAGGMRNGCIFARPMSVPTTNAIDGSALDGGTWLTPFGMSGIEAETGKIGAGGEFAKQVHQWATPDANAMERTNRSDSPNATVRPTLALAAVNWATPKASDGTKGGPNQAGSKGDLTLPSMTAQWSTPNVPNGGRSVSAEVVASRGKTENGKRQVGLESEVRHWATPTSSENSNRTTKMAPTHGKGHGIVLAGQAADMTSSLHPVQSILDGRELSPTARTLRRRLNPAFACWLMGWPIWWTNPAITNSVKSETESWRLRLHTHLSLLLGEQEFSKDAA
jgi:hypothetical protein